LYYAEQTLIERPSYKISQQDKILPSLNLPSCKLHEALQQHGIFTIMTIINVLLTTVTITCLFKK